MEAVERPKLTQLYPKAQPRGKSERIFKEPGSFQPTRARLAMVDSWVAGGQA